MRPCSGRRQLSNFGANFCGGVGGEGGGGALPTVLQIFSSLLYNLIKEIKTSAVYCL